MKRTILGLVAAVVAGVGTAPAGAAEHTIRVLGDNTFEPKVLSIEVGDSVTWTNEGGLHNVRGDGFRCANGCDGDGMGGDGSPATNDWSFTLTFDEEGTVAYLCEVHVAIDMTGTILVGQPSELTLTPEGFCPGPAESRLVVEGLLPNGEFALMRSESLGSGVVPGAGSCAGTPLGLEDPVLVARLTAGPLGAIGLRRGLGVGACGDFVQVMDLSDCRTSNTAQMPLADASPIAMETIDSPVPMKSHTVYAMPEGGPEWLFIVERAGLIRIYDGNEVGATPFLDIRDQVLNDGLSQGLLGLGFHPDYANNGFFYVHYVDLEGSANIARFKRSQTDFRLADPDSEELMILQPQPDIIHQGGPLVFGPDGYLYVALGDGGPVSDPHDQGQDLTSLMGKILRLDVDSAFPYAIPPDNPFVDDPNARDEIWAYGLRNPWKVEFDSGTGDLYVTDVGNGGWEEINVQPADSPGGENYGWSAMEGPDCFDPPSGCNSDGSLILPEIAYRHFDNGEFIGCAIIGGFVYRGSEIPDLVGKYIYSDWCGRQLWAAEKVDDVWEIEQIYKTTFRITTFGETVSGEIFLGHNDGVFYRVIANPFAGGAEIDLEAVRVDRAPVGGGEADGWLIELPDLDDEPQPGSVR